MAPDRRPEDPVDQLHRWRDWRDDTIEMAPVEQLDAGAASHRRRRPGVRMLLGLGLIALALVAAGVATAVNRPSGGGSSPATSAPSSPPSSPTQVPAAPKAATASRPSRAAAPKASPPKGAPHKGGPPAKLGHAHLPGRGRGRNRSSRSSREFGWAYRSRFPRWQPVSPQ